MSENYKITINHLNLIVRLDVIHVYWLINSLSPNNTYMFQLTRPPTIGSDNDLSPDRRQAIIWSNAGLLVIRSLDDIS